MGLSRGERDELPSTPSQSLTSDPLSPHVKDIKHEVLDVSLQPALTNKIRYHSTVIEQDDPRVFDEIPQDVAYPGDPSPFKHPVSILLHKYFGKAVAQDHEDCNVNPWIRGHSTECCTIVQNLSRCRDIVCRGDQEMKAQNLIAEWKAKAAVSHFAWFSMVEVKSLTEFTSTRRALKHILSQHFVKYKVDWDPVGASIRAFVFGGLSKDTMRALMLRFGQSTRIRILPKGTLVELLKEVFRVTLPEDNEELMRWRKAVAGRKTIAFWRPARGNLLRIKPEHHIRNRSQRIWKRGALPHLCKHGKPVLSSTPRQRLNTMLEMPQLFFIKNSAPRQWRN
jgi:hypothetical protein